MVDLLTAEPPDGVIATLIEGFGPRADRVEVELPWGGRLAFRAIRDRVELRKLQMGAREFARVGPESAPNRESAPFFDTDEETKAIAYALAQTSLDPQFTPLDLLRLAKQAVLGFEFVKDAFNSGQTGTLARIESEGIDRAKKDFGGTPDGETA